MRNNNYREELEKLAEKINSDPEIKNLFLSGHGNTEEELIEAIKTLKESQKNMPVIEIKYFSDKIDKLGFIGGAKSNWIDLRAAEDMIIKKGEFKLIPLGVAMKLPDGYEAHIAPRSSTFKKFGIIQTNSIGIIDNSYCGDNDQWLMPVYAVRDTEIHINDRICQFRIMECQPKVRFHEKDHLEGEDRGGFGSTGTN